VASLQSLRDLFVEELKDIYNAEQQLLKALPKMRKGVTNPRLATAFEQHLEQTRNQVDRLERIFQELQETPRGKKCKGMEGLIEEGEEMLEKRGGDAARDAALIGAAQRVEHYEIAAYGTACAHARATGNTIAEQLLQQTLEEEKETDRLLTEIAEGGINEWATEEEQETSYAGRTGNGQGNGRAFGTGSRAGTGNGRSGRAASARAGSSVGRGVGRRTSGSRGTKGRKSGRSASSRGRSGQRGTSSRSGR
jgi:ferritin-like metal-binding protein YciE